MRSGASTDLRVALVGYGLAGRVFHAPLITHTKGMNLSAVVSRNSYRREQAEADSPGISVFGSSNELYERASEFDVAVIATPTGSHVAEAVHAIRSGLHVVVEKPVAGTASDAKLLGLEAAKYARQVHVFQNRRWDSDFLSIRALKDSGVLGSPLVFESRMESLNPIQSTSWRNSSIPQDAGGVMIDLGSHLVDQALQLMGPAKSVSARAHSVRHGANAEDFFSLNIVHEDSSTSLLVASKATPWKDFRFKVLGTRATVRVGWEDSQERALRDGIMPDSIAWGEEPAAAIAQVSSLSPAGDYSEDFIPASRGQWNTFYSKVRDAILKNQPPPVALQDAIETLRVLDAARTSAICGEAIVLKPLARHDIFGSP